MAEQDPELLLEALKLMLKERQLSYPMISEALGVSLPTIKRLLNKATIPLERLMEICDFADIGLAEVIARAEDLTPSHTFFSAEQDDLFYRHPYVMSYFFELFQDHKSPSQIAKRHKLSPNSTELYLSQLERVRLLERDGRGRVTFLVSPPLGFSRDSRVLRLQQGDFIQSIVKQVLDADPESTDRRRCTAILKPLDLPEKMYRQMIGELIRVVDRYAFLSESPVTKSTGSGQPSRSPWQLAIAAGPADESSGGGSKSRICNVTSATFRAK